jgi:hypothetical protein
MDDIFLQQLIKDLDRILTPDPDELLKRSLHKKLGTFDRKGYYRSTQLIVYLRIRQKTFNRMVWQQHGIFLDRIHYKQAAEILVFIEGKLTLVERQVEEQKYLMMLF